MKKIYLLGNDQKKVGGGWSFVSNLAKYLGDQVVDDPKDSDVYFVTSVSMLPKLSVIPPDKKLVLRVDNALLQSRNRSIYPFKGDKVTMMEGMRLVAKRADLVIYQSQWAKNYLDPFLKAKNSTVILNSVDETIFNPEGAKVPHDEEVYLYSRSSRHDQKGWHIAWYEYQFIQQKNPNAQLWIAGHFSPANVPTNFDFFAGEDIKYLGFVGSPQEMAIHYRSADHYLYCFEYDACSNTLIEALMCGTDVIYYDKSGGAKEIEIKYALHGRDYFKLERMGKEYEEAINVI